MSENMRPVFLHISRLNIKCRVIGVIGARSAIPREKGKSKLTVSLDRTCERKGFIILYLSFYFRT